MAGSRLHKIGTIFTRTTGLTRSGALKLADKPIWYDVYEAFPPKVEPRFDRPEPSNEVRNILYEEDKIRAEFYKKYGNVGIINMFESSSQPAISELYVQEYLSRKKTTTLSGEELTKEIVTYLQSKGIYLKEKSSAKDTDDVSSENKPFALSKLLTEAEADEESSAAVKPPIDKSTMMEEEDKK